MAPLPPPPAKCPSAAPTTICDLDDDVLREVFLRLPALPSLVRAALACRTFLRAVRSSPKFRRRFQALHPSPFVGLFIQTLVEPWEPRVSSFDAHHCRADLDFAAAVRGGDFALTGLPDPDGGDEDQGKNEAEEEENKDEEDEEDNEGEDDKNQEKKEEEEQSPVWQVERCSDGYVVLFNRKAERIAAYNPLTRALHLFPSPPGIFSRALTFEFHIVSEEGPGTPPRVVCFFCGYFQAFVGVVTLNSAKIEWRAFPEEMLAAVGSTGKMVNGSVYWTHPGRPYLTVLNTATLRFSRMDLPGLLAVDEAPERVRECDFVVGNAKDGRPSIVCPDQWGCLELQVYFWRPDEYDGVERWMLDQTFNLETINRLTEVDDDAYVVVRVMNVVDGIVYLRTAYEGYTEVPELLLSFCLETAELKKICKYYHKSVHPYTMAWPPSLVPHDKACCSKDQALSTPSSEGSEVKAGGGPTEPASVAKA